MLKTLFYDRKCEILFTETFSLLNYLCNYIKLQVNKRKDKERKRKNIMILLTPVETLFLAGVAMTVMFLFGITFLAN